jgi:hypothetical protein
MRITIDVQESEITTKTTQTGQTREGNAQATGKTAGAEDAANAGSPAADLLEQIQGAASPGRTAGLETPNAAGDGGGAPIQ